MCTGSRRRGCALGGGVCSLGGGGGGCALGGGVCALGGCALEGGVCALGGGGGVCALGGGVCSLGGGGGGVHWEEVCVHWLDNLLFPNRVCTLVVDLCKLHTTICSLDSTCLFVPKMMASLTCG